MRCPSDLLPQLLDALVTQYPIPLDATAWIAGRYKPTPTIIEAARHLFVRTEADERNLSDTARRVESLIERARAQGEKIIVFVTGVPGAGKTLVGLNIATSHREQSERWIRTRNGVADFQLSEP
jgi:Mrp family chromosome partitioning ATPase